MADVGEVRYKAIVDNSKVDEQVDNTEKKLKKLGDAGENSGKKIQNSAEKVKESVKRVTEQSKAGFDSSTKSSENFSRSIKEIRAERIEEINASLSETQSEINKVNSALQKTPRSIGLIREKHSLLKDEISDTKDKLKQLKDAQKEAKKEFESGDIAITEYRKIKREVLETKSSLKELKKEANTSMSVIKNISKGIGTAFVGLASAAGAGVAAVAKMGIEYNAQMQSYQTAFTTMLGSAEKAQKLTDDLKEMAAATPLAMTDLADASQILLAFGSSAEELPDQLKRLGDVAQGDAQALGTMATAFGRIQSNGYASLEEINMMIDQGFNPLNIIAEQTGETMAEVRDRVSAGEVSFEELSNALQIATDEGGQFFNAMQNQSETFEGQMSTLEDNLSALAGALTEDLFGSLAENTLPQVNAWVDELMTAAEEGGVEGAIEASGSILTEMITSLLNGAPQVIDTATSLVQSFLGSVRENGPEIMEGAIGVVMNLIEGFIDSIPELIDSAAVLIAAFLSGIDLGQVLEMGIRLVFAIVEGLITAVPRLVMGALDLIGNFFDTFKNYDWSGLGIDIVKGIIDGLSQKAGDLWEAAQDLASRALRGVKDFFGIHSPSKVMRDQVGKPIALGMAEGMEEAPGIDAASKELSKHALSSLTADVNYNLPDVAGYAKSLSAEFTPSYRASTAITVPLYLDGREVARATAWWTGEQLSWEEM